MACMVQSHASVVRSCPFLPCGCLTTASSMTTTWLRYGRCGARVNVVHQLRSLARAHAQCTRGDDITSHHRVREPGTAFLSTVSGVPPPKLEQYLETPDLMLLLTSLLAVKVNRTPRSSFEHPALNEKRRRYSYDTSGDAELEGTAPQYKPHILFRSNFSFSSGRVVEAPRTCGGRWTGGGSAALAWSGARRSNLTANAAEHIKKLCPSVPVPQPTFIDPQNHLDTCTERTS